MFKLIYFVLFLILLCGCKKADEIKVINESMDHIIKDTLIEPDSSGKIYEGLYVHNANSSSFRDCAIPDSSYWIIDDTKKLNGLYQKFHSPKNIYGVVYAKLKGFKIETTNDKTKEKFPKTLIVKEIIEVEKKTSENTCIVYDFWGLGSGQDWTLQISKKENIIEFFDIAGDKEYYFFYEEEIYEDGRTVYASHNNIQRNTIKIFIKKEICSGKMSDQLYEYNVEVILNGSKIYKGCGIKGKK
ncbi:MAG: hypothetical protein ABIY50_00135 [Ignavibacteria bacterium]